MKTGYSVLKCLFSSSESIPAKMSYCHFNEGKNDSTFSLSLFGFDLNLRQNPSSRDIGHGAVVWDASVVYAKYMELNSKDFDPSKLAGKTVLELGSGCGLAGMAYMMRGAQVTFTDMEKVVTTLTDRNVQTIYSQLKMENSFQLLPPTVVSLDWTATTKNTTELLPSYDIILLTDCIFSMNLVDDIVRTISLYSNSKTTVICCHEIRDEVTNNAFVQKLSELCKVKKVPKAKMHAEYTNDYIEILQARFIRISDNK